MHTFLPCLSFPLNVLAQVNTLHTNLSIPVVAKFRVFPDVEKTVEYAKMLEKAGAQILQCHGRIREQRGVCTVRIQLASTLPASSLPPPPVLDSLEVESTILIPVTRV